MILTKFFRAWGGSGWQTCSLTTKADELAEKGQTPPEFAHSTLAEDPRAYSTFLGNINLALIIFRMYVWKLSRHSFYSGRPNCLQGWGKRITCHDKSLRRISWQAWRSQSSNWLCQEKAQTNQKQIKIPRNFSGNYCFFFVSQKTTCGTILFCY